MTEEVMIRMGLDASTMSRSLRSAERTFSDAGQRMRKSFTAAFENFAGLFSFAAIGAGIKRAIDSVERIQNAAANWGVSTDFVQDIRNVGIAAGMTGEKIEGAMDKFTANLPNGSSVEDELYKLSDRLGDISDPAERAKLAIDSFGKAGISMLPILSQGSRELKSMASEFAKFSETDIKALQEADAQLDTLTNRLNIWAGKAVGGIAFAARVAGNVAATGQHWTGAANEEAGNDLASKFSREGALKAVQAQAKAANEIEAARVALGKFNAAVDDSILKTGTLEEKLAILEKQFYATNDLMSSAGTDSERLDASIKLLGIEEKMTEEKKKQATETEKTADEQERMADKIGRQQIAVLDARLNIMNARDAGKQFTVEEMASSGFNWNGNVRSAQRAVQLSTWARENRMVGRFGLADQQDSASGRIRSDLMRGNDFIKDPMQELREAANRQVTALEELLRKANAEGLAIKPTMAD